MRQITKDSKAQKQEAMKKKIWMRKNRRHGTKKRRQGTKKRRKRKKKNIKDEEATKQTKEM